MGQRIKHISELPEWFDLGKYEPAEKLDAAGWYEQLIVRRDLGDFVIRGLEPTHYLQHIRSKPIVDVEVDTPFCFHSRPELESAKSELPTSALGVSLITILGMRDTMDRLEPSRWAELNTWYEDLESGNKTIGELKALHKDWFDEPASKSIASDRPINDLEIRVNLNLPDVLLVMGFRRLLASYRHEHGRTEMKQRYRPPSYEQLYKSGVLPWLDLRLWEIEEDVQIPNRVMADAIFPAGEGGEEVVRKTTRKLANQWMSHIDIVLAEVAKTTTTKAAISE